MAWELTGRRGLNVGQWTRDDVMGADGEVREECGVVGICSFRGKDVSFNLYSAMLALQHRGQDGCGISTLGAGGKLKLKKGPGLVEDTFTKEELEKLGGSLGIGSTRYPTTGTPSMRDAQPFLVGRPEGGMACTHNGNLANYLDMRDELRRQGWKLESKCDSEIIVKVFAAEAGRAKGDLFRACASTMRRLDGAYAEVIITGRGDMAVFRDPYGIKPLCYGWNDELFMAASESVALDINKVPLKGHVKPGEMILLRKGERTHRMLVKKRFATCMFEYVYFSRPDSSLDAGQVYDIRIRLGEQLGRDAPAKADVIVPMPDTARPAAEGFSRVSGMPVREGLIKNRYIGRTFIMPRQEMREEAVRIKVNPLKSVVRGKRVVLIDDSIVRGTTTKQIVNLLRDAGAKEVHVRITCPPIVAPCFYGIDMSNHKELIAANHSVEEIRKIIGADSLAYQKIGSLNKAIGLKAAQLCNGCLHEKYPTPLARRINKILKTRGSGSRYWEEATAVRS